MSDSTFTLKVTGTGISIDQKISKELAARIAMLVLGVEPAAANTPPPLVPPAGGGGAAAGTPKKNSTSLREYLNEHQANKITQQIAAIGAYREAATGKTFFTREELDSGFREAKVTEPGNPTRDIASAISLGWIAAVTGEKNQYYVTNTGETAIESNFTAKVNKGGGARRKKQKKAAKKAGKSTGK